MKTQRACRDNQVKFDWPAQRGDDCCCSDTSGRDDTRDVSYAAVGEMAEVLLDRTGSETQRLSVTSPARAALAAAAVAPGGNCGKRLTEPAAPEAKATTPGWRPRLGRVTLSDVSVAAANTQRRYQPIHLSNYVYKLRNPNLNLNHDIWRFELKIDAPKYTSVLFHLFGCERSWGLL